MATPIPDLSYTDAGVVASQASSAPSFDPGPFNTGPFAVGPGASAYGAPDGVSINNTAILIVGGAVAGWLILRAMR